MTGASASGDDATDRVKCAILGAGRIGWSYDQGHWDGTRSVSHAACYARDPRTELVAVFEPEQAARAAFANGYRGPGDPLVSGDLDAVLALRPDCVSVCSPSHAHADHIERLLDEGTGHIWIEKPVTLDLSAHEALLRKWEQSRPRPRIAVNYLRRGLPQYERLRTLASQERPVALQATYSRGLEVNGVHMLDQIGFVLDTAQVPQIDWIEPGDRENPSFGLTIGGTRVTVIGMDLPYHCIEIALVTPERRLSVVRGGLELREERVEPNTDYPGFHHLGPPGVDPAQAGWQAAMREGTWRNLQSLLDDRTPPASTLETSVFAARLLDRVQRAMDA